MSAWSGWLGRLYAGLEHLRRPRPTGMPAPDRLPPEPEDPSLGPAIVALAPTLDWRSSALEAAPSPGVLLLALAPTLDWGDPVLRRGLADPVWTPPPVLRDLVEQARARADAPPLYELGVALPAHTLTLSCLALLRSIDDPAIGDLPCPAAGGSVRDFPDPVQTAMFRLFDLKWPPTTPGAPIVFV